MGSSHFQVLDENRMVGISTAAMVALGLMLPMFAGVASAYVSHPASFVGVPIQDTIFANITDKKPDSAMLPGGVIHKTQDTIEISKPDYSRLPSVNLTEAIESARAFLRGVSYLSALSFEFNSSQPPENHLWPLKFSAANYIVYVEVNSISGRVVGFSWDWVGNSPVPYIKDVNKTQTLNAQAVDEKAVEFLKAMNYTLSPFCRVLGPTLGPSAAFPNYGRLPYGMSSYFTLLFYNVMNNTFVPDNVVSLDLDIETGDILGFCYIWTYIKSIPVEGIISASTAERVALAVCAFYYTDIQVTSSMLVLENWGRFWGENVTDLSYRLAWVVLGTYSTGSSVPNPYPISCKLYVEVNPLSGTVYAGPPFVQYWSGPNGGPITQPAGVAMVYDVWVLALALMIAALSFVFVKKLVPSMPAASVG